MRCLPSRVFFAALCLCSTPVVWAEATGSPRVATFRCDVTPPLGQPLVACDTIQSVEEPLLAKGIVLESAGQRYVLCAVDWCELCNGSHDSFCSKIADAAGTTAARVAVQTVHQHTAPLVDVDAQKLMAENGLQRAHLDPKVVDEIEQRLAAAVKQSLDRFEPFDHVGVGQAKVDRVASSRRPRDQAGNIQARASYCRDPAVRALPEGTIDPWLKTITLARGDKPLVRLHYYATHPQTKYGDGRATSDVPGIAREQLQRKEGVFQIYFDGCGGDITLGKYNDGTPECRQELAGRLLAGMEAAVAATKLVPAGPVCWRTYPLLLPARTDHGFSMAECLACLRDAKRSPLLRMSYGALPAAFYQRAKRPIELSCLQVGDVYIVQLPGEPLIDFQLFAQKLKSDAFVAVAGYGDCGPGYICPAQAFRDGGYEPTDSFVKPESEGLLKRAIAVLLGAGDSARNSPTSGKVDHSRLMAYWTADGQEQPIRNAEDWAIRRRQIVDGMEMVMGNLPAPSQLPPPEVKLGERVEGDGFVRIAITYRAEENDRVPAYLFLPNSRPVGQRVPALLALHQTTDLGKKEPAGEGGDPNLAYAKELAQRGYVVLAPDYPSFGDYRYDFRKSGYASGSIKGVVNHIRGVDLLQSREEVDPERIGVIGHSLGGHNAMFLGAFDPRVKVIVSSCGWTPLHDYYGGNLAGWAQDRYMPRVREVYALDADRMPFDFHEVAAALAPRAFFSNSPLRDDNFDVNGVKNAEPKLREVYALLGAADRIEMCYPDTAHAFSPAVRREAYAFIDRSLGHAPARRIP
jgi:dienelactone hydrolase